MKLGDFLEKDKLIIAISQTGAMTVLDINIGISWFVFENEWDYILPARYWPGKFLISII